MPFDGSGVFQPLVPPSYPAAAGQVIRSSYYNAVVDDLIDGINAFTSGSSGKGASLVKLAGGAHSLQDFTSTAAGNGAALVGVNDAAGLFRATSVESALAELAGNLPVINAKAAPYNLTGDPSQDASDTVDAILSAAKALGGATVIWPHGTIKLTREHLIDFSCLVFKGTGRRKVYPGVFVPTANVPTTFWAAHAGRNAFRVYNATINVATSLTFEDVNFATIESGSVPTAAIGWDGSGNFHRDYVFNRCGIHGFTSAFDTYNTGGDTSFGLLKVTNCVISRNNYIARNVTGQWNGFLFANNEAGQNITGGIDVKGQAVTVAYNSLEGQPNAVKVTGNYRAVNIIGNYFEVCSGAYIIHLQETVDAYIGKNYYQTIVATERIKLTNDINTTIDDTIAPSPYGSMGLICPNGIDPTGLGSASMMFETTPDKIEARQHWSELGSYTLTPTAYHKNIRDSAATLYTTTGTGLVAYTKTGLSQPTGTWFAVAITVSYDTTPALQPRWELKVNSTNTDGYINTIFYNWNKLAVDLVNRTVTYFALVKATNAVTTFQVLFYPYGINPAAGLTCQMSLPDIYAIGTTLPAGLYGGATVKPFTPHRQIYNVVAAPASGTWPYGWNLRIYPPVAGGYIGTTCTLAGSPGTWKSYGAILP